MKRSIEQRLLKWKQSKNHKPLIIRGTRQVGKTYTINDFGDSRYDCCIKLDFEKDLSLMRIFEGDLSAFVVSLPVTQTASYSARLLYPAGYFTNII